MNNLYKKFNRFISISKFIWNHPLASKNKIRCFYNFFNWQLVQNINSGPRQMHFVENSLLMIKKGMEGATGNIYTGLLEFEDMSFVLHTLQPNDLFADVGSNVGVYSVLASKNRGAESISFEPVASTFNSLKENLKINNIEHLVKPIQKRCGCKERDVILYFKS